VPWLTNPLVPLYLSVFALFFMHSISAYRDRRFITDPSDWLNIVVAAGFSVATALVFAILLHVVEVTQISRRLVVGTALALAIGLLLDRQVMRAIRNRLRKRGLDVRRVLVVGAGGGARRVRDHMRKHPSNGMHYVGTIGGARRTPIAGVPKIAPAVPARDAADVEPDFHRLTRAVQRLGIDEVIVAWPEAPLERTIPLIVKLDRLHVRVRILHPSFHILSERLPMHFESVHGEPIVEISPFHGGALRSGFKRFFDFTFGAFALVVSLPLWVVIGLVIKLQDGGAVFYRQRRVARGGRTFDLYKFRTMIADADQRLAEIEHLNMRRGPMFKIVDDPRCTTAGRWLRRYRLDELPQFLNVMRGEISVVGTRPPLVSEVEQYWPWQTVRLRRWIGITGLWQICGRDDVTFDEVVLFDLFYDRNASFFVDLAIIWKTIGVVLSGRGGY
jgi:exopolysaccharide biosynthesis polyprenyl glycosylphosphotransferase